MYYGVMGNGRPLLSEPPSALRPFFARPSVLLPGERERERERRAGTVHAAPRVVIEPPPPSALGTHSLGRTTMRSRDRQCGAVVWRGGVARWCGAVVWRGGVARRCGAAVWLVRLWRTGGSLGGWRAVVGGWVDPGWMEGWVGGESSSSAGSESDRKTRSEDDSIGRLGRKTTQSEASIGSLDRKPRSEASIGSLNRKPQSECIPPPGSSSSSAPPSSSE